MELTVTIDHEYKLYENFCENFFKHLTDVLVTLYIYVFHVFSYRPCLRIILELF